MFALWHNFKEGHLDRQTLVKKSLPIRSRMKKCLNLHLGSSDYHVRKASKSLLKHWDGLFTFLEHEGVEPTNNSAEKLYVPQCSGSKSVSATNPRKGRY